MCKQNIPEVILSTLSTISPICTWSDLLRVTFDPRRIPLVRRLRVVGGRRQGI